MPFESRGASRGAVASAPLARAVPACPFGPALHRKLNFARIYSISYAMNPAKKQVYKVKKYRTINKYVGKRRKVRRQTAAKVNGPERSRPNPSVGNYRDSDFAGGLDAAANFVSASQKKLEFFEKNQRHAHDGVSSAVLCDIDAMTALVGGAECPSCREHKLVVREVAERRKGLSSCLELRCENSECASGVLSSTHTSRRVASGEAAAASDDCAEVGHYGNGSSRDSFAANVKAVVASRAIGIGHDQLSRFCAIVGLAKPMHHKTFQAISKKVHDAAMRAVTENLNQARAVTKQVVGSSDVAVMYDGTWQKRGHKSHNGVGAAISLDTGLCLDFEVLSNYCHACSLHNDMGSEEEIWQAYHRPVCEKNTDSSAHGMEAEAALRIWERTLLYETPLRFATFLSDGDSKAYNGVCDAKVYGAGAICKEDCTNHVAKRLGTGIRKLPTPLPRGEKLKPATIEKLQTYYQIAITGNRGNLRDMYTAIWASYFHSCSTDGAGSHNFCPPGQESWCKHKRAEAMGEPAPQHTPLLTKAQGRALLPIYKRLSDEKLLARCLRGKTQNAAESLNSKVWLLCPKTKFASRSAVETATAIAVLWYNRGHASFEVVLEELGVLPPASLTTLGDYSDKRRIQKMNAQQTAEARAHRRTSAKRARLQDSARKDREGVTYSAGEF